MGGSGADLEYARLLAKSGASNIGADGAYLEQLVDLQNQEESGIITSCVSPTNVPTPLVPNNLTFIPGMLLFVPPTYRDIVIKYRNFFGVSQAGLGDLFFSLYDMLNGPTLIDQDNYWFPGGNIAPAAGNCRGETDNLGSSTELRCFGLFADIYSQSAPLLNVNVYNYSTKHGRSWMRAEAL